MRTGISAILALSALTLGAMSVRAQDPRVIAKPEAVTQLQEAVIAVSGADHAADATDELRELALALPALEGVDRRQARAILARPPSGEQSGSDFDYGTVWSVGATAGREFYDSPGGQFRIHYVTGGDDAADPGYVELVAERADHSEQVENDELGWPAPKSDGDKGDLGEVATGRTDIYLADLAGGLFGYAATDDHSGECTSAPYKCFAYLVLDNDYAETGYGYGGDPDIPLSATVAHEYNHVLQFNLDTNQDSWMFESTATWAEEKAFPAADDWIVTFMDDWAAGSLIPVTKSDPNRFYGSAVWNHWLDARYGADTVLRAWQLSRAVSPKDYAVGAYDRAIKEAGSDRGFPREFGRFAAATSEWQSGSGGFPDAADLPDVSRRGTLTRGQDRAGLTLDNTAYRLFHVDPRAADEITLRVTAPRGLQAGLALVGRRGPAAAPNRVVRKFREIPGQGRGSVKLKNAQTFDRITAVVVNADGRVDGSKPLFGDFSYRRDNQRLTARIR